MGINRNGRFAAITNYRKLPLGKYTTSRGDLVKNFLTENDSPDSFMNFLIENGQNYEGFNLIFGNMDELLYFSNRGPESKLEPSVYGLSNHLLDTPWTKVKKGKERFSSSIEKAEFNDEDLFKILANKEIAPDNDLPETGVGLEKERMLSSIFIESPNYGTRLSTVLTIGHNGKVNFHERSFIPKDEKKFEFEIG